MPSRAQCFAVALFTLTLTVATPASGPSFWTVATAAEFLSGRSDGVFVSRDGVVTAGPQLTSRLSSTPPQVWALTSGADGTLVAGTGGDGHVLRLRPGQPDEVLYDAAEPNVFALAASASTVYAATGPDGRVHAIAADGSSRVLFDPPERYIWALAVDSRGRVWVGAGDPAVIYRVDASGAAEAIYRPPAAHVVSLVIDGAGRLLAGTDSPGRLYRIEESGRPFVLLESGMAELRAVAVDADGTLFAAAVAREGAAPASGETASIAAAAPPAPAAASTSGPGESATAAKSRVFRIAVDGTWESIWETGDVVYDLARAADGTVLVATGPEGRLYRLGPDRAVSLMTGVDAGQITRFAAPAGSGDIAGFATANPGRVVAIGSAAQSPATYLSPVLDTKTVATWGLIRWEANGSVALSTRSGNTARPDDSWSDWSAPYTVREGTAVASPAARFVQWRAVLQATPAGAPSLSAVTLAYLSRNSRPVVSEITVHPPGVVFQRPFSSEDGAIAGLDDLTALARRPPGDPGAPSPPPGRRMFQRGLQTIAWKADDSDRDRLAYTLRYRRDGDQTWRELRAALLDTIYVWDTTTMADGRYVVRVEASDDLSNTGGQALVGQRDSAAFIIDNTPPAVTATTVREAGIVTIHVDARDAQSPIQKAEYSLAGGPWQMVGPADGLADALNERFEIRLAAGQDGTQVVVRVTDLLQNVTSVPAVR